MMRRVRLPLAGLLLLAVIPALLTGCSSADSVGQFLLYRYEDFCDMADIGMTFSYKPGFALYANGVGVSPGGFAYIDGYFLGLGGGVIGLKKFYFRGVGLIAWGHETIGWDRFTKLHNENFNKQGVGVLGILFGPHGMVGNVGLPGGGQSPDYLFACIHNIHLGFIGAVANLRYTQAPDFILGWFGLDPALDDGLQFGRFPWQKRRGPSTPEETPTAPASTDNDIGGWAPS